MRLAFLEALHGVGNRLFLSLEAGRWAFPNLALHALRRLLGLQQGFSLFYFKDARIHSKHLAQEYGLLGWNREEAYHYHCVWLLWFLFYYIPHY